MHNLSYQPITLGSSMSPTRLVLGPHSTGIRFNDTDALANYYVERAKNGVGMIVLGVAGVDESSPTSIPLHSDDVISLYRPLAEQIHDHRTLLVQQLWHAGPARALNSIQPISASSSANLLVGVDPRPITTSEITLLINRYEEAARRVKAGGLDGVEIHAAHGYLLSQFLSPATNHRDDKYGGSLKNRMRIVFEVLAAARRGIGTGIVGIRLSARDDVPGGLRPDDVADIAVSLEPYVDYISVSTGSYQRYHRIFATSDSPSAYQLKDSRTITHAVSVPTIVVGRIQTLDVAESILDSGDADMVALVRPFIADPAAMRIEQSRPARPCIGTNEGCVGHFLKHGRISCSVNPTVLSGKTPKQTSISPSKRKRFLVAGAGPAGLEAARVLAELGHKVRVVERASTIGGQLNVAAKARYREDIGALVGWYQNELERLNVEVRLRTFAEPDLVEKWSPDGFIVATGSEPSRARPLSLNPAGPIPGHNLNHVLTTWELLNQSDAFQFEPRPSNHVLVYDDSGEFEALSVVDELLNRACKVSYATRYDMPGARVPAASVTTHPVLERMVNAGVSVYPYSSILNIGTDFVDLDIMRGQRTERVSITGVVLAGINHSLRDNADLLKDSEFPIEIIGDATGSRTIRAATAAGHRAALKLGAPT